ncbi:hypothetical protein ACIA8G_30545 [Lentzea sp. NPDC051213]|uniref:hypothetical protein n=1 Tax=Lentzea sp. NPDC051213 TaxID=3364126 RepID=UPI00378CEBE0
MEQPAFRDRVRGVVSGVLTRPARLAIIVGLVTLGAVADNLLNSSPFVLLLMSVGVSSALVTRWSFAELGFKKKD